MAGITEGLPIGQKWVSDGRTIAEGEFTLLHNLTWMTAELHTNQEYAKLTQFGQRILAGPCVLALVIGLTRSSDFHYALRHSGFRLTALLERLRPITGGNSI